MDAGYYYVLQTRQTRAPKAFGYKVASRRFLKAEDAQFHRSWLEETNQNKDEQFIVVFVEPPDTST